MKSLFLLLYVLFSVHLLQAQIGINTATPDASSMLDIASEDRGILIPRITTANRVAMPDVQGMLVFDRDLNQFFFNDGAQWVSFLTGVSSTQAGTFNLGNTNPPGNANWIYYNVIFPTAFTAIPSISLTLREGTGIDNAASDSIIQIKVVNASITGFTIAVRETESTQDHFVDWIAVPRT